MISDWIVLALIIAELISLGYGAGKYGKKTCDYVQLGDDSHDPHIFGSIYHNLSKVVT
jgi:hypothetical protein